MFSPRRRIASFMPVDEEEVAVARRGGRRRRYGTSRCATPGRRLGIVVVAVVHRPRDGRCARSARRPTPGATSQSLSSTMRASMPSRGRPQVPRTCGLRSDDQRPRRLGHVEGRCRPRRRSAPRRRPTRRSEGTSTTFVSGWSRSRGVGGALSRNGTIAPSSVRQVVRAGRVTIPEAVGVERLDQRDRRALTSMR